MDDGYIDGRIDGWMEGCVLDRDIDEGCVDG
jgi:hypothetical protein